MGSLLFNIYINDLQRQLNLEGINYIFYEDDLQVYLIVPREQILQGIDIARLSLAAIKSLNGLRVPLSNSMLPKL